MPTGWNKCDLVLSKKALAQFRETTQVHSPRRVKVKLSAIQYLIDDLERFVPWPALIDSFAEDARKLRAILDRME